MRRGAILLLMAMGAALLSASGVAVAFPSESPDPTPMLNGPVRTIEQVGNNVWVGGNFTQVKKRDGTVLETVSNVAVFDSVTGQYLPGVAPKLGAGSTATNVRDIDVYGTSVVIAGDFPGPTSTQKNLVMVDGATGGNQRWFGGSPQKMQSVLAAPDLGVVYGGGRSLEAFDFATAKRLWSRATTAVDPSIHSHNPPAGYKDLERDGSTIWAACVCDDLSVSPSKALALVKLDVEGNRDASWVAEVGSTDLMGISVAEAGESVYLGAGGSDWVAGFSKADGSLKWKKDTSGSAQVVEVMEGQLVVGGHFVEVADQASDRCGARTSNPDTLDPFGECQRRDGLAVYSFDGVLDPNWNPALTGKYDLTWALHPDSLTGRLYVGGEFTHVNGVRQEYYTRLSPELLP